MNEPMPLPELSPSNLNPAQGNELTEREWLVTNGLGGYASGTASGALSRRYHGLLVAALPAPLGRMIMFNYLTESLRFNTAATDGNNVVTLGTDQTGAGDLETPPRGAAVEFRLDCGLPVWTYRVRDLVLEKRILLPHGQNTAHITYRVKEGNCSEFFPTLELRPAFGFRRHETAVSECIPPPYEFSVIRDRYEINSPQHPRLPPLRLRPGGAKAGFEFDAKTVSHVIYPKEKERGYPCQGNLWSPGFFSVEFDEQGCATLIASTEDWKVIEVLDPHQAVHAEHVRRERLLAGCEAGVRDGFGAELALAADQFVITPKGREEESARASAQGDAVRTIIAGYHWFNDWGRDTMISLEGLTLLTGRHEEARCILHTFSHYVRRGLIPNMFPEGEKQSGGLYNTADATLWYFHALQRYLDYTQDRMTLRLLLPMLNEIIEQHLRGTDFHIHVDPEDGLLCQGQEGVQLTWMDAKVDDWVVTPRRGKAVEINALWINALSLLTDWLRAEGNEQTAKSCEEHAQRAKRSFNKRFWNEARGCLFDVVDGPKGDDDAVRPNQIFAISLPYPALDREYWEPVLGVVEKELLTPVGLRSLSPHNSDYKPTYHGDRKTRDAAYHQGTVWPWLIGAFVDAWLKCHSERKNEARDFLKCFPDQLHKAGIGTISEVFDAEEPHIPRGCIAQAWSVAEVLRAWAKTTG
jgi:predicted glycogen debranching enzyme